MSEQSEEVARAALSLASGLDARIARLDRETKQSMLDAWAEVFEGCVWLLEARMAVREHYSRGNAFQISAGDVVEFCSRQEPWSSRDHAQAFLRRWASRPYSHVVEDYTGLTPPAVDSTDADPDARYEHAAAVLVSWVEENLDVLTDAVLSRKYRRG